MSPVLYKLIAICVWGFWATSLGLGLWLGDRPVRLIALAGVAAFFAGWLPQLFWAAPPVVVHYVDALTLVPMVLLALHTRRPWLFWMCAFQTGAVATYVARALDPDMGRLAFATTVNALAAGVQACLLWGAVEAERRRNPF